MGEFGVLIQGAMVVVIASCVAMWLNDNFHLGGEFNEEMPPS